MQRAVTRPAHTIKGRIHNDNWYGYRRGEDDVPEIVPEEGLVVLQIFRA